MAMVAATCGACASLDPAQQDRIVDTASGLPLTPAEVVSRMRSADIVLLGELHDNPHHHARRAALIAALGSTATVVAEHLPSGAAPTLLAGTEGDALRRALEASGFDAKGWRWPLHEPLFAAIARAGMPLRGGNLVRDEARKLAREGAGALSADLAPWTAAAPLTDAARAALEQDLLQGHCGHLTASRLPGMVAAQQGRDAAMAQALLEGPMRTPSAPRQGPLILLAGNGHVRRDYGVPAMLTRRLPRARVLTVGFDETAPTAAHDDALYDIMWRTPAAERDDPCKAFTAPAPARAASA
jgi:uncharacterized iron-regulated protein